VTKKKSTDKKDPYYQRELEKYDEPVPSREYILQTLEDLGCPATLHQLENSLDIGNNEDRQKAFGFRLKAMLRDGQLMQDRRNRYCLLKHLNIRRGIIQGHPDGFGFFIPEDESPDMRLSPREMRIAMDGDTVLAYQSGTDRRDRPLGKIHEVIIHANTTLVGRFFSEHGICFVSPNGKRLTQDISIPLDGINQAKHGQMVLVELIVYPSARSQAIGRIVHIIGDHMAPGLEIEVAILAHGIPEKWPEAVLAEAAKIPQHIEESSLNARTDLRHLPFVTIDGEDAKDFDDAVFCKKTESGDFQLYVAIADVSHYVPIQSALDKEASKRGNSVYFPEKVVPMLPEALSNGICSLNPKVDRLCLVAEMQISTDGAISHTKVYRGVIHSQARLTYTEVAAWLDAHAAPTPFAPLWPIIQDLYTVYTCLLKARLLRGAIEFDTIESRIIFDENRKIKQIVPVIRNEAHRIIEECMLAANVTVARFLKKAKMPMLYRNHESPNQNKTADLRAFLGEFGLQLPGGESPTPKDFQQTLAQAQGRPDLHLIQTVMLRSLKQAQYQESNTGHFGLAYPMYTHFTSPIRRYPDLLIHRAIGHCIDHGPHIPFHYSIEDMARLGRSCSDTERRADDATREVISWLKCEFMRDKIGQTFDGRISSVTSFGLFVELNAIYAEGLVHITALKNDYYAFDSTKHRLVGGRTGHIYRLGDPMRVLVARVDLDERKIDFEPVE